MKRKALFFFRPCFLVVFVCNAFAHLFRNNVHVHVSGITDVAPLFLFVPVTPREGSQKSTTMPGATPVPGTTTTTVPGATPTTVPGTTPMTGATPAMPTGTMMPGTTFTDATPDSAMPMGGGGGLGIEGGGAQGSVLLGASRSEGGVSWLANMATGDASAAAPLAASAKLMAAPLATLLCHHLRQLLL